MGACGPHCSTRAGRRLQPHDGRLDLVDDRDRAQADPPDRSGPASFIAGCSCPPLPPGRIVVNTEVSRSPPWPNPGRPRRDSVRRASSAAPWPRRTIAACSIPSMSSARSKSRATWFAGRRVRPCSTTCLSSAQTLSVLEERFLELCHARICASRGQRQGRPHASRCTLARGADRGRAGRRGSSWRLGGHQTRPAARDGPASTRVSSRPVHLGPGDKSARRSSATSSLLVL